MLHNTKTLRASHIDLRQFSEQIDVTDINEVNSILLEMHIASHMFRHTFATVLPKTYVDIRSIQESLRHSSINIT